MDINEHLQAVATQLLNQAISSTKQQVDSQINKKLSQIDFRESIDIIIRSHLDTLLETIKFPPGSITHETIDFTGLKLTGDMISGGIIENFGSTGIEDRATFVQMTLMDHAVAFENPIFAPSVEVKGPLVVNGDLSIRGDISTDGIAFNKIVEHSKQAVKESLNNELFQSYSDLISVSLKEKGIDLDTITQGGKEVISGNKLGYHITDTNIQRVGIVRDLQTTGENLLCNTLYVTDAGRVGVNTMDPSAALSIWDEEVEITVSKRSGDTGYVSTPRFQRLIIGSNNKENLIADVDGSVKVNELVIGKQRMTSAKSIPNHEATYGTIVWNEEPQSGGYIGWVCMGGPRWAGFGKIE